MKTNPRFKMLHDFLALSGGQAVSKVVGFFAFAYLARTLEPAAYGSVEYAASLALVFMIIIEWGLGPIGVREIARDRGKASALSGQIPATRFCLALIAIPVMGLSTLLTGQDEVTSQLVWLFVLGLLAVPWKQDWLFQGLEMMNAAAAAQAIRMIVFAAGVFLFVRNSTDLLTVGYVEVAAAATMVIYFLSVQRWRIGPIRFSVTRTDLEMLARKGIAVGLSSMVWAFIQYTPLFVIATVIGGAETGLFAAAHRLVLSVETFSQVYHFNLYPVLARRAGSGQSELTDLMTASFRVVAWGGILFALAITLLAQPILVLIFGASFAGGAQAFAVLIWVIPITALSGHVRWALVATGHERSVLYAHLAAAAGALVTGAALIPIFSSLGAAITMVVAAIIIWGVAHGLALGQIGRVPGPGLAAGPGLLALAIGLLTTTVEANAWLLTMGACLVYAVGALVIDRRLLTDLRHLLHAKADFDAGFEAPRAKGG